MLSVLVRPSRTAQSRAGLRTTCHFDTKVVNKILFHQNRCPIAQMSDQIRLLDSPGDYYTPRRLRISALRIASRRVRLRSSVSKSSLPRHPSGSLAAEWERCSISS